MQSTRHKSWHGYHHRRWHSCIDPSTDTCTDLGRTSVQTLALFHQTKYRLYELRYRSWHGCIDTDIDFGVDPGTDLSTILSTPAPT